MSEQTVLLSLMQILGYHFKDTLLLEIALCHRSHSEQNNERLEFLGDAVLGLIFSQELYARHPHAREGELSRMRSALINGSVLAKIAQELKLNNFMKVGPGEEKSGGKNRVSILADAVEAVVGAIFIDGGLAACKRCVLNWYGTQIDNLSNLRAQKDAKTELQEWLQARKLPLPNYIVQITGEAHAQKFTVTCQIAGLPNETTGMSTTRRGAEQIAAKRFLELLNE